MAGRTKHGMKKGSCGCTNHRGKPKPKYPSQDMAIHRILTFYAKANRSASAYKCPKMEGVWHITSSNKQ